MKLFFIWFFATVTVLTIVATVTVVFMSVNDDSEKANWEREDELFQLSLVHINDFHARFEETNEQSLACREGQKCIGGFARLKTVVDELMSKRVNAIFLNAGDNFQGTFWYNLLRYNVTAHFLNFLPTDATTLGNHEFAHRVEGLVPFLSMLNSPVVMANIDARHEPSLEQLFQKSIIVERSGRKIGIIGVILKETSEIANTDQLKFLNEITAIRDESTKLRTKGVNIIIVLSHCGLARDREIALEAGEFVDVIVGGHSHSFLFTSEDKSFPGPDQPVGSYPVVVTPKSGVDRKVLIVHASAFTKFVGDLTVYFNAAGHVKYYEGNPVFLDTEVKKNEEIEKELIPWREEVARLGARVIGRAETSLMNDGCRHGECALGSFIADAFLNETQRAFPETHVFLSILQAAGIRSSLVEGNISYADIVAVLPFENTLDILQLQGKVFFDIFEHSVSRSFVEDEFIGIHMLQVSGFEISFNVSKPVGQRLQTIQVKTKEAGDFENINPFDLYNVIVPSFIAAGGDGFTMIKSKRQSHRVGLLDIDVLEKIISEKSPLNFEVDGRIVMKN